MPRHLLSVLPEDDHFPADRLDFLQRQAHRLSEYAFFGDLTRYAELAAQLNTETSKAERGFILGYMAARAET